MLTFTGSVGIIRPVLTGLSDILAVLSVLDVGFVMHASFTVPLAGLLAPFTVVAFVIAGLSVFCAGILTVLAGLTKGFRDFSAFFPLIRVVDSAAVLGFLTGTVCFLGFSKVCVGEDECAAELVSLAALVWEGEIKCKSTVVDIN